jgi:hypothetical protein
MLEAVRASMPVTIAPCSTTSVTEKAKPKQSATYLVVSPINIRIATKNIG